MKKKATSSTIAGTTLGKEGPSPPPPTLPLQKIIRYIYKYLGCTVLSLCADAPLPLQKSGRASAHRLHGSLFHL